jgi:tubulin--tyrosine ligase
MADRGMGIRIFHTKDELLKIFEEFDGEGSDDDAQESTESGGTAVVISQLRHFVIQVKDFCYSQR